VQFIVLTRSGHFPGGGGVRNTFSICSIVALFQLFQTPFLTLCLLNHHFTEVKNLTIFAQMVEAPGYFLYKSG
jgi:hypothetical protein